MGQYYYICYKGRDDDKVSVNHRKYTDSGYIMAKLMEHSYMHNRLLECVAHMIENHPTRVMWVGDYSEDDELKSLTGGEVGYEDVWGDGVRGTVLEDRGPFDHKGKFLVNHTKRRYLSYDDYVAKCEGKVYGWTANPLSLLTAVGNGRGNGDYGGTDEDKVGKWAWDMLEITSVKPEKYRRLNVVFTEE